jgi:ankyrin repeat protein
MAERGAKSDAPKPMLGTLLHSVARRGKPSIVRILLDHSAAVRLAGGEHRTSMNAAAFSGLDDVVELLLQHSGLCGR